MDEVPFNYFNPYAETLEGRNRLSHWEQKGALYFITFRLADSIPTSVLESWKLERDRWLTTHPKPWTGDTEQEFHSKFSVRVEQWLDTGHGACWLRQPATRQSVIDAIRHFDGDRYRIASLVVMPNHVHLLVVLNPAWHLSKVIHSWKRHSAAAINANLGRRGGLWQKDYFDRMVRDGSHFENCVRYIRRNPAKGNLQVGQLYLYEGDLVERVK